MIYLQWIRWISLTARAGNGSIIFVCEQMSYEYTWLQAQAHQKGGFPSLINRRRRNTPQENKLK